MKKRTWIYVQVQIVGSGSYGYAYYSDLEHCKTRDEAWQHGGWKLGHDDFLVAAMEGGRCVALYSGPKGPARRSRKEVDAVNAEFGFGR